MYYIFLVREFLENSSFQVQPSMKWNLLCPIASYSQDGHSNKQIWENVNRYDESKGDIKAFTIINWNYLGKLGIKTSFFEVSIVSYR